MTEGQESKFTGENEESNIVVHSKQDSTFAVISDIDDTIQKSDVVDKGKLLQNIFLKNYTTQKRIYGMPELLNALDKNNDSNINGDIFYVSGSPINLSERIQNFLSYNTFPNGSIGLKKLGVGSQSDSLTHQEEYKLGKIRAILNSFPKKKFLLFGDSGEKDPEIYGQISKEFPDRIMGIYIHNVSNASQGSTKFDGMVLHNDSKLAAEDLYNKGFITIDDIDKVKKAVGS